MSRSIAVSYTWDKETALRASEHFYRYEMRHTPKRYIGWLFIAMAQFGIVGALKHDSYGLLLLSTLLLAYWYYLRWVIRRSMVARHFNRSPLSDKQVGLSVDEEGLKSGGVSIPWTDVLKVIRVDGGFLVYLRESSLFFSRSSFQSTKDIDRFEGQMRKHTDYQDGS